MLQLPGGCRQRPPPATSAAAPSCIYTVAGKFTYQDPPASSYSYDGLVATDALLESPMGLSTLDSDGNYYVQGYSNRGALLKVRGAEGPWCNAAARRGLPCLPAPCPVN